LALTTKAFWDANKHKFKGSKFKSSPRKGGDSKVRHCYNCGGIKHFIAESPYKNKEDHGGPLIPKYRSSKFSSSKKHRNKDNKKEGERLLVAQEEYDSGTKDDDDSDDEENGEMATIAIVSTPPTSLFNSQNENAIVINHKCLMAKATEVTSSPTPSSSSSKPISMDDVSSLKIKKELLPLFINMRCFSFLLFYLFCYVSSLLLVCIFTHYGVYLVHFEMSKTSYICERRE
jgi:hypothetical protein